MTILREVGPVISTRRSAQRVRHRRDREVLRRAHELERPAGVQLGLALLAGAQQLAPPAVELLVQLADQRQPVVGEHLVVALLDVCPDLDHHALVSFL